MEKNRRIISVLFTLGTIFMIMGGTIAYYNWQTTEEQKTLVSFIVSNNFSCSADGGGNITTGDALIIPTEVNDSTVGNYIKREVKVYPKTLVSGVYIYMDLWLNINELGTGLSNSDNFRYAFTTSSDSPTTGVVSTGNFKGLIAGNKIELFYAKKYLSTMTDTYYLWIWLDAAETSKETMNQSFSLSLGGNCYDETGADMLIKKANSSTLTYSTASDIQKGEMWTFSHDATEQVEATTDYRYIGSSPNNYITFNDEVWRIIGVFDGRIKIIRDDTLGDMSWDYKKSGVGSSTNDSGSNDWTDSQLMYMLNPTSYALKTGYSLTDSKIYDGNGNIIYQLGCKPASIASGVTSYSCTSNTWSLNSTALSQISEATYYLGGSLSYSGHSAQTYYAFERGTTVYNSGRPTSWTGLVGLMYPSDYAYTFANGVDDTCYTNTYNCKNGIPNSSWLYKSDTYQWTVSPCSSYEYDVFVVGSSGTVSGYIAELSRGVCPVVYLKSDIKLQGTGTSSEPYEIIN